MEAVLADTYLQRLFAERIGGRKFGKDTTIYKFEKIKRAKRAAKAANPRVEIIDLGVGEPDEMAFPVVVKELQKQAARPENRGYADNGIQEYKDAAAAYLKKVFGVKVDPVRGLVHTIGSKSALAMLPYAFINPGDVTLMTVPGYPILGVHTKYAGGEVYNMPLTKENGFLPDLKKIPADIRRRAKLLYINYPNNPTGAVATKKFFREVVEFAKKNKLIVVQDAAYAALVHKGGPMSFLSVPGAKDVGVEIHSMSKAYNMTGWRLAFVAGNEQVVEALATVKDNTDSGQFIPIQRAGIKALADPGITQKINAKYKRRLTALVDALNTAGFHAKMPGGTFYLYVQAPKAVKGGPKFRNAEEFSQYLIKEKLISTVPWDDAGAFFRCSATFEAKNLKDEKRVLEEIKRRLGDLEPVF